MQRWSGPIAGRRRTPVDDAARARTIRAVIAQSSALRLADAAAQDRAKLAGGDDPAPAGLATKQGQEASWPATA